MNLNRSLNTTYLKEERTSELYELATHLKHKENTFNQWQPVDNMLHSRN